MQKNVLLLFGGESSEHDVSIVSAQNVFKALDKEHYNVHLGYITRDGDSWQIVPSFSELEGKEFTPLLGKRAIEVDGTQLQINVLFPVLHGKHGEDGEVQSLAQLLHVPYVGPSVIGAAVTMDKDLTKHLLRDAGVPVVEWTTWTKDSEIPTYKELARLLGETLFVKPSSAGSSIGVSKVEREEELLPALELAASHDSIVMIERAIEGQEIELSALGNRDVTISTPGEILPDSDFYSYDAKYAATSTAHATIPADLSAEVVEKLQRYAKTAYQAVRGRGMARIDFFVTAGNDMYLNEINSIPGFTDISMYPKMWEHDGISYSHLIDRLIALAIEAADSDS